MSGIVGKIFRFCRAFSTKSTAEGLPKTLLNINSDTIPLRGNNAPKSTSSSTNLPPQVLINCLRNNIFIHVCTTPGHDDFTLNAGTAGFRGTQKTSQKAALAMMDRLKAWLTERRIGVVRLNFRGINSARAIIVGQLRRLGLRVTEIVDTTGIPFNGCRPPKKRRL